MAKLGSMETFGFKPKEILKIQKQAELAAQENLKRKDFWNKEIKTVNEQKQAESLMTEGATYSNSDKKFLKESEHKHGTRTPVGNTLKHGPRGGQLYGQYKRVG